MKFILPMVLLSGFAFAQDSQKIQQRDDETVREWVEREAKKHAEIISETYEQQKKTH